MSAELELVKQNLDVAMKRVTTPAEISLYWAVFWTHSHLQGLESQSQAAESPAPPVITEPATTDSRWDVAASTRQTTPESLRSALRTTDYLVASLYAYAAWQGAFPDDEQILVLAAQARNSISVSQASSPCAEISASEGAPSNGSW